MTITWNWGTGIGIAYTAFALSTIGFVGFAMRRPVSLVSDDYYEQSLREDAKRSARANTAALGSAVSVAVSGSDRLELRLPADQAATAAGTLTFYRASDPAQDRVVAVTVGADGIQSVPLHGLPSGLWLVQVRWTASGRDFYVEQPVALP